MFGNKLSFRVLWKYIACSVLLNFQTNVFSAENEALYEQIERQYFVGRLWLPGTSNKKPAILLIGGSGGGYENQDAKWLSSLGFVVLNIRYFGAESLPKNLVNIPIEYFNTAFTWLDNHTQVKKGAIGLFGHSKGTEAAILTAYYNPLVKAVVVRAPSAIVWAGPGWSGLNESSWSWNNEPLAYHSVGLIDGAVWLSRILRGKKLIKTYDMFDSALDDEKAVDRALLPIEHIKADLLFLSGKEDQQWPSTKMADKLVSILDESNFRFSYKHIAFDNAGHRPGRLSKPDDTFANGGTAEGNIQAHTRTKVLVKTFFDKSLR
jgi:dienelactone hydrolase